jgi:hypothetical protein
MLCLTLMTKARKDVAPESRRIEEELREEAPTPPDGTPVNESWDKEPQAPRGLRGVLFRLLDRVLRPRSEAQQVFHAHQVQLDNEILRYLEERLGSTHRHYDRILGAYGRRLDEADARHVTLEKELVGHVEDLIRRIDLVLARGERGRLSLEHELKDVRRRLEELRASRGRS